MPIRTRRLCRRTEKEVRCRVAILRRKRKNIRHPVKSEPHISHF